MAAPYLKTAAARLDHLRDAVFSLDAVRASVQLARTGEKEIFLLIQDLDAALERETERVAREAREALEKLAQK